MKSDSRRDFLKKMALAGASALAVPSVFAENAYNNVLLILNNRPSNCK